MKKAYLILTIVVIIIAVAGYVYESNLVKEDYMSSLNRDYSKLTLNDEEYLIYPSDNTDKWNVIFPSGDEYVELKPEQIALFLKSGEIPKDTTWVIYPQCEYQLTMEDDYILIEDFGRPVAKVPYAKTGDIGKILIKENE